MTIDKTSHLDFVVTNAFLDRIVSQIWCSMVNIGGEGITAKKEVFLRARNIHAKKKSQKIEIDMKNYDKVFSSETL